MPCFSKGTAYRHYKVTSPLSQFRHEGDIKTNSSGAMSQSTALPWEEGIPEIMNPGESPSVFIDQKLRGNSKIMSLLP